MDPKIGSEFRRRDALIRFYFKIDPDELSDEEYYDVFHQLMYVLKETDVKFPNLT